MEVESFEDEGVAKLLNDWFVSIKVSSLWLLKILIFGWLELWKPLILSSNTSVQQVDREERPDVDKVKEFYVNNKSWKYCEHLGGIRIFIVDQDFFWLQFLQPFRCIWRMCRRCMAVEVGLLASSFHLIWNPWWVELTFLLKISMEDRDLRLFWGDNNIIWN